VEAGVLLEQAGQDRAEEGAEVDAQVEQREARVAGVVGAYSDPTTAVALAVSPPAPSATRMSSIATPAIPGTTASAMWPSMIMTALQNSTRSLPSTRSASQPPMIVDR
jgi:hypothetical protein